MSTPYRGGDRCPTCGKVRYLTRDAAKKVARRFRHRKGRLNAYQCGNFWHLGHLPKDVTAGRMSRADLDTTTTTATANGAHQ